MKYEIKLIKMAIQEEFPDCKLSVKYIVCHNYALSGDRIAIKTDIPYVKLMEFLYKHTEHIIIYRKGDIRYSCESRYSPVIFGYEGSDADFIEIEEIPKGEELWKRRH